VSRYKSYEISTFATYHFQHIAWTGNSNSFELEQTLHQEWQRLTQVQIRRLVGSMRRRLAAVIRVNGNYTNY
jgi:hypothetical protein